MTGPRSLHAEEDREARVGRMASPMLAASTGSGSSWLDLRERNMSALACRERDQMMRSRGKCRVSSVSLLIRLFTCTRRDGMMALPIATAADQSGFKIGCSCHLNVG